MRYHLHTDHHTAIGFTHLSDGKPCQDHALSGVFQRDGEAIAYAVVSDGCSSAGETDIGARLVTTLTAKHLKLPRVPVGSPYHPLNPAFDIGPTASNVAVTLGLNYSDLAATQLYAIVNSQGEGHVMVNGDGMIVLISTTGAMKAFRFEWANEMPYYPLYSQTQLQNFFVSHGGREAHPLTVSGYYVSPDRQVTVGETVQYTTEEGVAGIPLILTNPIHIDDTSDLSMIALFTDGIWKFDKMEWVDTLCEMTAFKNRAGAFAKRRSIRAIKDALKVGHGPNDDVSMAVISIIPAEIDKDPALIGHAEFLEKPAEKVEEVLSAR